MDPNVQVAIATVIGTAITTLGIVVVALINSKRGSGKGEGDDSKDESTQEDPQNLELIRSLILENARKEATIVRLREENVSLKEKLADRNVPKEDS